MSAEQFRRRRRRQAACLAGLMTVILAASSAGIWMLLAYAQNHALAAAEASQVSDDVQGLVRYSLRVVDDDADVARLRVGGRAAALRLQAHLRQLQPRHVETEQVAPMAALVQRFFAQLDQEDAAL